MSADAIYYWANWVLVGALLLGVAATYAIVTSGNIRDSALKQELAAQGAVVAQANERAASLEKEAAEAKLKQEELIADNLALQTVLLPRHVGLIGVNEEPKAKQWFAGMEKFAGIEVAIQVAPDAEAHNLANEIAIVLSKFGLKPQFIDENQTHIAAAAVPDGVQTLYQIGKPWNSEEQQQPWFMWHDAAEALADALTKAGLGVGNFPVSRGGFVNVPTNPPNMIPYFDPPLSGVYLEVGSRPVAATLQWMASRRKANASLP
jgi:hypothetical protein